MFCVCVHLLKLKPCTRCFWIVGFFSPTQATFWEIAKFWEQLQVYCFLGVHHKFWSVTSIECGFVSFFFTLKQKTIFVHFALSVGVKESQYFMDS